MFPNTVFVTGTDTGVGKTAVSQALIEIYQQANLPVKAMKPISSGAVQTANGLRNPDAELLMKKTGQKDPYSLINPYVFEPPIAPHLAAAQAGVEMNIDLLFDSFLQLKSESNSMIIEGVGGWQVPITNTVSLADWVNQMQWSVILVVGIKLGCINHARLTYSNMRQNETNLIGWVANQVSPSTKMSRDIVNDLQQYLSIPLLADIPYLSHDQDVDISPYFNLNKLNIN